MIEKKQFEIPFSGFVIVIPIVIFSLIYSTIPVVCYESIKGAIGFSILLSIPILILLFLLIDDYKSSNSKKEFFITTLLMVVMSVIAMPFIAPYISIQDEEFNKAKKFNAELLGLAKQTNEYDMQIKYLQNMIQDFDSRKDQ